MQIFPALVIVTLALAFAGLATRGTAQGNGLPERYAIYSEITRERALTSVLSQMEGMAAGGAQPFPVETRASGALAGLPMWYFFPSIIWPWIVVEDGRPVALALDLAEASQPGLPSARRVDDVKAVDTVRELSYDRLGDTLRFRAVYSGHVSSGKNEKSMLDWDERVVSAGAISPGDRPGCLTINSTLSTADYYHPDAPYVAATDDLGGAYAKASLCFSVSDSSELSDGTALLHFRVDMNGVTGRNDGAVEQPLAVTKYAVAIPLDGAASAGAYVTASGVDGFHAEALLEDINRFAASLEQSIARHEFDLAARQVESLNAYLADLEAAGARWSWVRRPTAAGVTRYNDLMEAIELYRLANLDTQARVNDVRQQLLVLRSNFSGNIVKSMLKSTINWMNVVPTDPVSGLAGYSDIAGALLLPQSMQSWKETADSDASILASQARAIRHFEALEVALAKRLVDLTEASRALFERVRENDEARALELDAALRND